MMLSVHPSATGTQMIFHSFGAFLQLGERPCHCRIVRLTLLCGTRHCLTQSGSEQFNAIFVTSPLLLAPVCPPQPFRTQTLELLTQAIDFLCMVVSRLLQLSLLLAVYGGLFFLPGICIRTRFSTSGC
jgi:hypothetical protein